MKRIAAIVAASMFTLAACSSGDDVTTITPTSETTPTTSAVETPAEGTIGQPFNISVLPGNEVNLTIKEITIGESCRYGTNDYSFNDDPTFGKTPEGKALMQIWADVDVVNVTTSVGNNWIMIKDPVIIDSEGFTQLPEMDIDCKTADDGHELWSSTVDSGTKMRIYGSFIVPEDVSAVNVEGIPFDVASAEITTTEAPAPTTSAGAPIAQTEVPSQVIGYTGAPGIDTPQVLDKTIEKCGEAGMYQTGTTFFTDGTTGWTEHCSNQMLQ